MEVTIDFAGIKDWNSFHSEFQEAMGFPPFYGRNMDAWIDCMSYVDDPAAGMTRITVQADEDLEILVRNPEIGFSSCPDVMRGFVECTAFVNRRFIESNSNTRLKIIAT